MNEEGKDVIVTSGWWDSFRRRNPNISLHRPESLGYARVMCCSSEVLTKYFDLLEATIKENGLEGKQCQIFNCDESGFPFDADLPMVVVEKGKKHPYSYVTGEKGQVTVLFCCSAGGYVIPPMVIFDRKSLKIEMTEGEVPGSMYGLSDSGWMDGELFDLWFRHHFLAHIPPARPVLLLLDGHSSHYTPSVINKAADEGIVLFCLPPHSTHITQPLDKTCFASLKRSWKEECHLHRVENPLKSINRYNFAKILHKAWLKGMTMHTVTTGFRVTGVYPLERSKVVPPSPPEKIDQLRKAKGISFMPLYSPHPTRTVPIMHHSQCQSELAFSDEETILFERRFEEGYDLKGDSRYNQWLNIHHPEETLISLLDNLMMKTHHCLDFTNDSI